MTPAPRRGSNLRIFRQEGNGSEFMNSENPSGPVEFTLRFAIFLKSSTMLHEINV